MSNLRSIWPVAGVLLLAATLSPLGAADAAAAGEGPVLLGALPGPLPLFPPDNWWNVDVSAAPVDPSSASYVGFIGPSRTLHPDLGGEVYPGSVEIYGLPFCVVDGTQAKRAVEFLYADESDGVDPATGHGFPFYPIPDEAVAQMHWIEGGWPGREDHRDTDRHLLVVDRDNAHLYELWNVWYDEAASQWRAGSGAFFDMKTNNRRPEGWTSADAAGLAILPGLVRYDEVYETADGYDIGHAFRVTVRATNGFVYPASHRAGSTTGALPMGARLRLKASVGGLDPALRTSDPNVRKIFRAMQRYGLIVADNGSDMYVTGTFDTRWNNDVLNPAFALLRASDFEVIQLRWRPPAAPPSLGSVAVSPATVSGGEGATGTATLTAPALSGGAQVWLDSDNLAAASVPASVWVDAGAASSTFPVTTYAVAATATVAICGSYEGQSRCGALTVNPPPPELLSLVLSPTSVRGGQPSVGTVSLAAVAPAGGAVVALASSRRSVAAVPASVTVAPGATSATFPITTMRAKKDTTVTISAFLGGSTKTAVLTVRKR